MTLKDQDLIELRRRIRHSAAHVMADVVTRMFPNVKLAIGPPLTMASTTTSICLSP